VFNLTACRCRASRSTVFSFCGGLKLTSMVEPRATGALSSQCRKAALRLDQKANLDPEESLALVLLALLGHEWWPATVLLGVVHVLTYWHTAYYGNPNHGRLAGQHRVCVDSIHTVTLELWDKEKGRHRCITVSDRTARCIHRSLTAHERPFLFVDEKHGALRGKTAWLKWATDTVHNYTGSTIALRIPIACANELDTLQLGVSVSMFVSVSQHPATSPPVKVRLVPRTAPAEDIADTLFCPTRSMLLVRTDSLTDAAVSAQQIVFQHLTALHTRRGALPVRYGNLCFSYIRAFGVDNNLQLSPLERKFVHIDGEGAGTVLDAISIAVSGKSWSGGKAATFANLRERKAELKDACGQSKPSVGTKLTLSMPGQSQTVTIKRSWRSRGPGGTGGSNILAANPVVTPSGALGDRFEKQTLNEHVRQQLPSPCLRPDYAAGILLNRKALRDVLAPLVAHAHGALDEAKQLHAEHAQHDASAAALAAIIRAEADGTAVERVYEREILPELARQICAILARLHRPFTAASTGDGTLHILKHAGTDHQQEATFGNDDAFTLEVSELSRFCIGLAAQITMMRCGALGFNSSLLAINEVPTGVCAEACGQLLRDVAGSGITVLLSTRDRALAARAQTTIMTRACTDRPGVRSLPAQALNSTDEDSD
jgi:hypothetical protein